jgi:predicted TPR repeat methyltransferase
MKPYRLGARDMALEMKSGPQDERISDPLSEANARMAAGDATGAAELLHRQIRAGRGGLLARIALGRALLAADDKEQALEILREAAALGPYIAEAAFALGEGLLAMGHLPTAIAEFQRALRLEPTLVAANYALGCAWFDAGEADRAGEIFNEIAAMESPFAARAVSKLSEVDAMRRASRAPPGYIRHLFDQFSSDYERKMLAELSYRAHHLLRDLADLVGAAAQGLDILDLGCGTGLAGEAFRDLAHRLDGVDLSPLMIERARDRGIYASLIIQDVEVALASPGPFYDLILAADTLVYLGDLGAVFRGTRARLKKGGFFLFTVEKQPGEGFELGPKRRYRHSEAYLREEADRAGLEVMGLIDCLPRREAKSPVEGLAVALQRN